MQLSILQQPSGVLEAHQNDHRTKSLDRKEVVPACFGPNKLQNGRTRETPDINESTLFTLSLSVFLHCSLHLHFRGYYGQNLQLSLSSLQQTDQVNLSRAHPLHLFKYLVREKGCKRVPVSIMHFFATQNTTMSLSQSLSTEDHRLLASEPHALEHTLHQHEPSDV